MPTAPLSRSLLLQDAPPKLEMGTYFVQTWGCQMNVEDSEQMELQLGAMGLQPARSASSAQVVILNTCSVRKKPEDKAFSLLGELSIAKEKRPNMVIGVCGCMAQARADEILQRVPAVNFVLGTGDLSHLTSLVEQALQGKAHMKMDWLPDRKGATVADVPQRIVTRPVSMKAFVPIQYGCDKFCTFCIVPATRGRERSRPTEDILEEVKALAANGTKEVTLLGQTVNSYGKNLLEGRVKFSDLLWQIAEIDGIERIRFTSPYPRDFKADLIDAIKNCPKVMEHCHLPLQSGDNDVLKAMHRVYTVEGFLEIVDRLRDAIPDVGLTTDIIVGFPGETEAQFLRTVDLIRQVGFSQSYCFAYSPRPGTPAAAMDQLSAKVRKERLDAIIAVQNEVAMKTHLAMVGQVAEVLVEGASERNPRMLRGYTRDFKMVHFPGDVGRAGRLALVRLDSAQPYGFDGSLL